MCAVSISCVTFDVQVLHTCIHNDCYEMCECLVKNVVYVLMCVEKKEGGGRGGANMTFPFFSYNTYFEETGVILKSSNAG